MYIRKQIVNTLCVFLLILWLISGLGLRVFAKEKGPKEQLDLSKTLHKEDASGDLPPAPSGHKEDSRRGIGCLFDPILKYTPMYGFDLLDIQRGIEGKISVDLSSAVQSKHMWHGFDLYDDHGVFLPAVDVILGDTGFSGKYLRAYPLAGGLEKSVQSVYNAFYTGVLLKDTPYKTNFTANYIYYGLPKIGGCKNDSQEVGSLFFWPKLITVGNGCITPSYYVGYIWASRSNSNISGCEGFIHVFGLEYNFEMADFWPKGEGQALRLYGDITYNDGFSGAERDWSHANLGISTNFKKGKLTITPSLNYQISMEDSVNDENELWCGVNATYRF